MSFFAKIWGRLAKRKKEEDLDLSQFQDAHLLAALPEDLILSLNQILHKIHMPKIEYAGSHSLLLDILKRKDINLIFLHYDFILAHPEICKEIHKISSAETLPIIALCPQLTLPQKEKLFTGGITDFLYVPLDLHEVAIRVRTILENQNLMRSLFTYQKQMDQELDAASEMQALILPSSTALSEISDGYNVTIESHFEASSKIGGDFWGVKSIGPNELALYIVDFSGHGVQAAMNTFRLHTIIEEIKADQHDPASFLEQINQRLYRHLPSGQFATMTYAVIDMARNELCYASAGSPALLYSAEKGGDWQMLPGDGLPLGIKNAARYENRHYKFSPTASLFLYSDVLVDYIFEGGKFIDEEDLIKVGLGEKGEAGKQDNFFERLRLYADSKLERPLPDDLTLLSLTRRDDL